MQDEISQSERRRILKDDRSTYHQRAIDEAGQELGRYKHLGQASVTGAVPRLPVSSPWRCDPVPNEPPLNQDVNAMEPVGEPFEFNDPSLRFRRS